jgi:hypothetical protein
MLRSCVCLPQSCHQLAQEAGLDDGAASQESLEALWGGASVPLLPKATGSGRVLTGLTVSCQWDYGAQGYSWEWLATLPALAQKAESQGREGGAACSMEWGGLGLGGGQVVLRGDAAVETALHVHAAAERLRALVRVVRLGERLNAPGALPEGVRVRAVQWDGVVLQEEPHRAPLLNGSLTLQPLVLAGREAEEERAWLPLVGGPEHRAGGLAWWRVVCGDPELAGVSGRPWAEVEALLDRPAADPGEAVTAVLRLLGPLRALLRARRAVAPPASANNVTLLPRSLTCLAASRKPAGDRVVLLQVGGDTGVVQVGRVRGGAAEGSREASVSPLDEEAFREAAQWLMQDE